MSLKSLIKEALREDNPNGDVTSLAAFTGREKKARGVFLAKEDLVLSGIEIAKMVFENVSKKNKFKILKKNGAIIRKGTLVAEVTGPVGALLTAERVALNFVQHLSGVATLTSRYVAAAKPYRVQILDTRKTLPGFRVLEKKAVRDGGGANHRMNLSDMYLIKDNHVEACGGVAQALAQIKAHRKRTGKKIPIEVEVKNIPELKAVLNEGGAGIILLDNMSLSQIRQAIQLVKGKVPLEISGGVNLKNINRYAATGVARISIGRLTHSAPAVDLSFEIA